MNRTTHDVTSTFVQTIDIDRGEAYERLSRIDPMRSLANRLSALGVDDRAIWAKCPQALGLVGADGRRELRFSLIWRFDRNGRHATLSWRVRVDEDGWGGSLVSLRLQARGSDAEARRRLLASWPLVETIAHQHARGLRRAVEGYAEESFEAEAPRLRAVV
jgi:hypothetical protein